MISLSVIVRHVLSNDSPQVPLTQQHDVVEAVVSDRTHEALGVCVQVRTPRREPQRLYLGIAKQPAERRCVKRVTVEDQVPLAQQKEDDARTMRLRLKTLHRINRARLGAHFGTGRPLRSTPTLTRLPGAGDAQLVLGEDAPSFIPSVTTGGSRGWRRALEHARALLSGARASWVPGRGALRLLWPGRGDSPYDRRSCTDCGA